MSAELEQVTTAVAEFDRVAAGLAELKSRYVGLIYDFTKPGEMDRAKKDRLAVRAPRYEIETIRKGAKAPILALGKKLDSEAARITAEILSLEDPIHAQITNEEDRKEAERLAKIEAERKRQEDINNHIEYIRSLPLKGAGKTSAHARKILAEAEEIEIGDEFAEFAEVARTALVSAIAALTGIVAEREAHEAEQERIKAEREELTRLRKEQAERDAVAERARQEELRAQREKQARLDAVAKTELDAEAAKQREEARLRQVELDRIEKERNDAWDAQQAQLAKERAEIERQKEEMAAAQAPIVLETEKPADADIITLVAGHWGVDDGQAVEWILAMDFSKLSIAA